MAASTKGLGPEKDCAGKDQQHIQKTDSASRQRGRHTERTKLSNSNKYLGHEGHEPQIGLDTKTY
jgi:hypothetical protein